MTLAHHSLDPQLAALLRLVPAPDYDHMTPESSRAGMCALAAPRATGDAAVRTDLFVAGVPVRRYEGRRPATVVYLHGGGWVSGDLDTHDAQCAALCAATGATVVAVDYRRAPEDPFPAGLHDCLAVLRALTAAGGLLAVAGDSAGANLAAAAALVMRDEGTTLAAQLLIYPATDLRGRYADVSGYVSRVENRVGYLLGIDGLRWFTSHYVTEEQALDPLVSVLLHPDLRGLPPTVLATAQFDPLRDEALAYADALVAADVEVAVFAGAGLVHGYAGASHVSAAAATELSRVHAAFAGLLHAGAAPGSLEGLQS